jgi:protein translocase SecG subunit
MNKFFVVIQVISAILIVVAVLLQQKGTGLSGVFGGSNVSYLTKRGAEKFLSYFTVAMAVIFIGSILLSFIIAK